MMWHVGAGGGGGGDKVRTYIRQRILSSCQSNGENTKLGGGARKVRLPLGSVVSLFPGELIATGQSPLA